MDAGDRLAIRDLVDRYSLGVTVRDEAMIAGVFADDAIWKVAAPFNVEVTGNVAIAAAIAAATAGMDVICQMVHSVVIEPDGEGNGDRARARCVMHEVARAADRSSGMTMLGLYADRLVRTPAGWRFAERHFLPSLIDDTLPKGAALG